MKEKAKISRKHGADRLSAEERRDFDLAWIAEIEAGIAELDAGEILTDEEVKRWYEQLLGKQSR